MENAVPNPVVDEHYASLKKWKNEQMALRKIVLEFDVLEEYKWKQPCYTYNGANVVIVSGFKEFAALNFFKGSLIDDEKGILVKPGENSQSARFMKFTSEEEIVRHTEIIKSYIKEAINIEITGAKITYKEVSEYETPDELEKLFNESPEFKTAFFELTPGRRKAYLIHFADAKQSATRLARIEKYRSKILCGKGMYDCTCGLSKKMPACDGSHKNS